MTKKFQAATLVVVVMAALGGQARALEPQGYRTAEGLVVTPFLRMSERWDDNFRAVETGEESSLVTTVNPNVNLGVKGYKAEFNLNLDLSHDVFHSSRSDDNTDRKATAMLGLAFNARNRLRVDAGISHVEETASLVQKLENDVFETSNAGAIYGFGAESARGQLEVGASQEWLRFKNSRALLNEERERDAQALRATFYVALAPRTKALAEVRQTQYEYISNTALDSTNLALLGGLKWEATAKTTGSIKVGTENKEFEATALGDKDNSMWEAAVTWSPLSYSTFTLTTNSRFEEGNNGAFAIESQSTALNWDHSWSQRLKSSVSMGVANQDYLGAPVPTGADRADELVNAGAGITYGIRRWLEVGLGYKFSENDSNASGRSFERNMVAANVGITL